MFIGGPVVVFKWQATEEWPVEYVSPNVKDVFGYYVEELLSGKTPYVKIIPNEDIDCVSNEVATYSERGVENFEHKPYRIIRKDRKTIWIADYTTILRDEAGKITHYLGYVVDITKRKKMEDELKARNAEMERFIYTVAHDLRSPLVTISGFAGMLKKDIESDEREEIATDLSMIKKRCREDGSSLERYARTFKNRKNNESVGRCPLQRDR